MYMSLEQNRPHLRYRVWLRLRGKWGVVGLKCGVGNVGCFEIFATRGLCGTGLKVCVCGARDFGCRASAYNGSRGHSISLANRGGKKEKTAGDSHCIQEQGWHLRLQKIIVGVKPASVQDAGQWAIVALSQAGRSRCKPHPTVLRNNHAKITMSFLRYKRRM